jgi:hypothetical protein
MREAYMREGVDHVDDPMIMNVARVCATCSRPYPSQGCTTCQFNPAHYTDQKRALLMRTNCCIHYDDRELRRFIKYDEKATSIVLIIFIVIAIAVIVSAPHVMSRKAQTTSSWDVVVNNTILQVKKNMYDVSKDGLINCQDYAILFQRYHPGGAWIIYNPAIGPTGHLFNKIIIGGKDVYIEPQAPEGNWRMEDAWAGWDKVKYLSCDVTSAWM